MRSAPPEGLGSAALWRWQPSLERLRFSWFWGLTWTSSAEMSRERQNQCAQNAFPARHRVLPRQVHSCVCRCAIAGQTQSAPVEQRNRSSHPPCCRSSWHVEEDGRALRCPCSSEHVAIHCRGLEDPPWHGTSRHLDGEPDHPSPEHCCASSLSSPSPAAGWHSLCSRAPWAQTGEPRCSRAPRHRCSRSSAAPQSPVASIGTLRCRPRRRSRAAWWAGARPSRGPRGAGAGPRPPRPAGEPSRDKKHLFTQRAETIHVPSPSEALAPV